MIPVTPRLRVKVVVLMVAGFIASLKVAVMTAREHTPVAPFAGVTETTVGGGLHPLAAVLKLHTELLPREIGRASRRERVKMSVVAVSLNRKLDGVKVKMVLLTS